MLLRALTLSAFVVLSACSGGKQMTTGRADSTRMVEAVLAQFSKPDTLGVGLCTARDGGIRADTGQRPCDKRIRPTAFRVIAFRPDSVGACVWIEPVRAPSSKVLDGGPFPIPVSRLG